MVAMKALIIFSVILLAIFVIVIEGEGIGFFARNITQAEYKCLNEFASELGKPTLKTLCFGPEDTGTRLDDAFEYGDVCETYLWFGRCLDIYSQNDSSVCNAEIQELIWKKAEILWNDEVESKCAADIQSFPQCHCLQEFLQTKTSKQSTENTIVQCSNYRAFENCTNEVRRKCVAKVLDFRRVPWGCEEAFALYKCYDEQFQNATHCNNDIKKPFWEHEKYQVKRIFETECECVVELFDEKIKNAIPRQKSEANSAYGFGI